MSASTRMVSSDPWLSHYLTFAHQFRKRHPLSSENSYHVCHKGYISIFPFLLGLLSPDSPHLGAILADIRDPEQLWSPYGIRSLSKAHPLFGEGENYWRGPIWVQMNYMALSTLYKVSHRLLTRSF
jgi:glycogen debranching enzyme